MYEEEDTTNKMPSRDLELFLNEYVEQLFSQELDVNAIGLRTEVEDDAAPRSYAVVVVVMVRMFLILLIIQMRRPPPPLMEGNENGVTTRRMETKIITKKCKCNKKERNEGVETKRARSTTIPRTNKTEIRRDGKTSEGFTGESTNVGSGEGDASANQSTVVGA